MQRFASLALAGFLLGTAVIVSGCPRTEDPGSSDGSIDGSISTEDAGDSGPVVDAGPVDAGFKCKKDSDCSQFKQGLRCEPVDGRCIPATPCFDDSNCQKSDPDDYCFEGGAQCRCVMDPAPDSGFPGVCHRRKNACEECTSDAECGDSSTFQPAGACKKLPGDTSGKKYCLQQRLGASCGCGMVDDGTGFCRPQNNSCSSWGCGKDSDCEAGSACNTRSCVCERRCRWDFAAKKSIPECGNENGQAKVCWVDSESLDPTSAFYGSGRCRTPCTGDNDCRKSDTNQHGGTNLKCSAEDLGGGAMSDKRCRANGECMDNLECPRNPPEKPELGYCDRAKFTCHTDCRIGNDPTTGTAYPDCQFGFKCEKGDAGTPNAPNVCRKQSCVELGGTKACARGQLCCGEDRNGDGVAEPCPQGVTLEDNKCFDPPKPPYCTECNPQNGNADCAGMIGQAPADGGAALPTLCNFAGARGMTPVFTCQLGTVNDFRLVDGQAIARRACPALYTVQAPPVVTGGAGGDNTCATDFDCSAGLDGGVGGKCGPDPVRKLADGGVILTCLCDNTTNAWKCPQVQGETYYSVCPNRPGIQACATSLVCAPPQGMLFQPRGAPNYGCGL